MKAGFRERFGPTALVAGASTGLGAAFAAELAARGLDLVLLARRGAMLAELATRLEAEHKVAVHTAAVDLAAPDLLEQLRAAVGTREIGLLVYNAAYSTIGPFLDQSLDDKLRVVDVNCRGPIILADELGRAMAARGRGGIVIMSSLAASRGAPLVSTYAASKAFGLVLAEGLWEELRARGVDVVACRAGSIDTPNYRDSKPAADYALMEPAAVARAALDGLGRAPSVIPGWVGRFGELVLGRLMSRRAAVRIMGRTMRRVYPQAAGR